MKKFICLLLAILMTVSVFAGCQSKENTLVMATNAAFPPYEYCNHGESKR